MDLLQKSVAWVWIGQCAEIIVQSCRRVVFFTFDIFVRHLSVQQQLLHWLTWVKLV